MFAQNRPYNDLPPIPIEKLETKETLKKAISANRALAELRAGARLLPNPVLLLRSVLLQEAKASSAIENVVTTNDKLYQALSQSNAPQDLATREVISYSSALWEGHGTVEQTGAFRVDLIERIASQINGHDMRLRTGEGCRIINSRTKEVVYTPPVGNDLQRLIVEFCDFLNNAETDVDPLIRMAAAHYQFEAIHPFSDGNGRTGRILNVLFLSRVGLLDQPILYLSKFILKNRNTYYNLIREVTEKARWIPWIEFMLQAVESTSTEMQRVLRQVRSASEKAAAVAREGMERGYSRDLIDVVFSQPYTRTSHVVDAGIAQRNAAASYLKDLERLGILRSVKIGRDVFYFNPSLAAALEISLTE